MAASASSSFSGVDPSPWKYDVFLSFRGEDTRNSFTSHLYHALRRDHIRAYVDEESLAKGDDVFCALRKAIEESAISIVILSLNYAASIWCLDELLHILKCKKEKNQIVVPIFVGVDPSDIQKQKNSYAEAFVELAQRFDTTIEKVQEWRQALTEVSGLCWWDLRGKSLADPASPDQPDESLLSTIIQSIKAYLPISSSANSIPHRAVERSSVRLNDSSLTLKSSGPKQPPIKLDELDFNCLEEIVKLLDGSSIRALAQVNRKLRIALCNMNLSGGRQPPYLLLSESSDSETCRLLRLHRQGNMIVTLPSPAAIGKRVWGSAHGWIVTMDPNDQLDFQDISSPDQEPLPPFPMIDDIAWLDWFLKVQKCLVFKIFPPEFLVVIILHPANVLYLTKPRKIQRWVLLSNPKNYVFRDVALFQGQVYALCDNGSIVKINFHESDLAATATLLDVSNTEDKTAERSYLVASPDHLYGVFQYDEEDGGWTPSRVYKLKFKVYKLNFGSLKWEAVLSIGNYAFFVGGGNSLCFSPASSDNYRRNCIYFTNEDSLNFPNRFVYGIFELGTRRPDLRRVNGEGVPLPHSCPTWIAYDLTPPNFRN